MSIPPFSHWNYLAYAMRLSFLLLLFLVSTAAFAGPIFPSRSMILAPQFRSSADTVRGVKFLRQQGIWGDLSKGFNSNGDRFYWSISTGGIIQFVEWNESMLYLVGDYDMAADQHSSIHFHPRGIFWTEGIFYGIKFNETELHTGYINRCHHDIDNLEYQPIGNGEERTLIYSSFLANAIWRDVNLGGIRSDLSAQLDWYIFTKDYLIPISTEISKTNFERLITSISLSGKFDLFQLGDATTYARLSGNVAAFNNYQTITADGRAELGIQLQGDATAMNIFIGFESFNDDGSRPAPVNSNFVYLGFRFIGKNIGL